jgi:hypothetical protein
MFILLCLYIHTLTILIFSQPRHSAPARVEITTRRSARIFMRTHATLGSFDMASGVIVAEGSSHGRTTTVTIE